VAKQFGKKSAAGPPERRIAKRDPVEMAVSLYAVGQSRVVLLLDVSPTGARFEGRDLPAVGKEVLLTADDVELFGTVVRTTEESAAIRFENPIGPEELAALEKALAEQTQLTMLHGR
jgi:hypothetical protein